MLKKIKEKINSFRGSFATQGCTSVGKAAATETQVRCPHSPSYSKITSDALKMSAITVTASRNSAEC